MDLKQKKLTSKEWLYLEKPIQKKEQKILEFIYNSYFNVNEKINNTNTLLAFTKLNDLQIYHYFFYIKCFENYFVKIYNIIKLKKIKIKFKKYNFKKADKIRINNSLKKIDDFKNKIYEFTILNFIIENFKNNKEYVYYTLSKLLTFNIKKCNIYFIENIKYILENYKNKIKIKNILKKSKLIIEKNTIIKFFSDLKLYDHQKKLFTYCKNKEPKLILYQAPTGTGKTVSPIGLVKNNKLIFVCASKHIGLQLAKNCISLGIKIAIAFGCEDVSDIRLHYFSAKEYIKNRKTGGIFKVNNLIGDNVEIIISDIQSYLYSMNYMLAFNEPENIIWYWDEPTITLDYKTHEYHKIIHENWKQNKIPNIILSSATLPKKEKIFKTIQDFFCKFKTNNIETIISYDFSRTIPIINTKGKKILPHLTFPNYDNLKKALININENKTILRYFDLSEIINFILFINKKKILTNNFNIENYFDNISDLNLNNIKLYYIKILEKLNKHDYTTSFNNFANINPIYNSTIKITTSDSHTLTYGPTVYLTDNTTKIGQYCLYLSNISKEIIDDLKTKINFNEKIKNEIENLNKELNKNKNDDLKKNKKIKIKDDLIQKKIIYYKSQIKIIQLPSSYIPNSISHLKKWNNENSENAFKSDIDDETVKNIMLLNIDNIWKILLIMGIGVFKKHECVEYNTIMKELANKQKLYLIIASSDYIYGMNYQFCHGYIGKDLKNLTKEKIIQSFGRIGRLNTIGDFTIRLRDDEIINTLFLKNENNNEIDNFNKLLVS